MYSVQYTSVTSLEHFINTLIAVNTHSKLLPCVLYSNIEFLFWQEGVLSHPFYNLDRSSVITDCLRSSCSLSLKLSLSLRQGDLFKLFVLTQ